LAACSAIRQIGINVTFLAGAVCLFAAGLGAALELPALAIAVFLAMVALALLLWVRSGASERHTRVMPERRS
jgi:hypothetical protein